MKMNEKIIYAMENNNPTNIERLCIEAFVDLTNKIHEEELCIVDFESLASVYKVDYEMVIESENFKKYLNKHDSLWQELDKEYRKITGNELVSAFKTLSEVTEIFKELNIKISFN